MRSKQHRQSLSLHAWGAILIIATLAVMSTLGSGALAWVARSDAEAINVAGSVRMATYRLNFQIATDFSDDHPFSPSLHVGQNSVGDKTNAQSAKQDKLDFANKTTAEKVDILSRDMENRLEELQVYQLTSANRHVRINEQLKEIKEQWYQDLKPALLAQDKQGFYSVSSRYIEDVNDFVGELQYRNEQRQTWQQNLQILSLLLIAIIVLIGMRRLQKSVLLPIQQLIKANNQFKRGQTQTRVCIKGYREFEVLGSSFNDMAGTIETYQRSLESEVQIKTQHLVKANQVLSLFYDFSKSLTTSQVSLYQLDDLIADFSKALPHLEFTLCIQNKYITNKNAIVLHGEKMKELCKKLSCESCGIKNGEHTKSYPIVHQQETFGELRVRPKSTLVMNRSFVTDGDDNADNHSNITPEQRIQMTEAGSIFPFVSAELDAQNDELIVALTNLISTALSLRKQRQQEHQLILFEERSTIARELHDSLAQSLSYLKIQVSVLERHLKNAGSEPVQAPVYQNIEQIKIGLGSAYQQLRDLLVTFRLTIDNDNFDEALRDAASEFASKGDFNMTVHNRIMTLNLSATEQIDLIQIAREALSNISRHAKAKNVEIQLAYEDGDKYIVMSIIDDGVGMSGSVDQTQHHGLIIMKERAHNIGGELIVTDNQPQGTIVTVRFAPNFFDEKNTQDAYL
ncbi:histidine kinase [Psychrobacter sp. Sarcosine-02u-2]|jgi:two-component system nitrate/nitrite sensor histidine kinase NarX|uniref:histidine kinase n=1 Tax=Psychrobacter TaxID=497 RepID=UPI0007F42479|nr:MULTISPECIES: histidine kinase [Psychrobacter]OAP71414.1 histidine kinase [Psychrobacter sp. SHUES1]PKG82305.1 histidine kinase [Psychrobacter sp. Sarcosine-02u-2]